MNYRLALALVALVAAPLASRADAPDVNRLFADSRLVSGDRISVEVIGTGPDVVLIPGLASSRATFRGTAERLRGRYRLHLVQVAGFAGAAPQANASGPVYAPTVEAIRAYIVSAGLKKPAIVGHSLGGLMALQLAADHPDLPGKLLIVDALAFYTQLFAGPQATAAGAKPYADQITKGIRAATDPQFAQGAAQTASMMATAPVDQQTIARWSTASTRNVMATAMVEDMTTDLRPRMAAIAVPVTVIYEAPLAALIQADYAPVPHKTLIAAAPAAKHFLMFDDPAGFDAALDTFLKS